MMFFNKKRKTHDDNKDPDLPKTGFTSAIDDFGAIAIDESSLSASDDYKKFLALYHKNHLTLLNKLYFDFGWNIDLMQFHHTEANMQKAFRIIHEKLYAPRSLYYYHGTSSDNYFSILAHGLNNGLIGEVNPGVIAHISHGTTFTTDFFDAVEFAISSAKKSGTSDKGMVIRWPSDAELIKGEAGIIRQPIPAEKLEFCLDPEGITWHQVIPEDLLKATTSKKHKLD